MTLYQNMRDALSELGEVAEKIMPEQIDRACQMVTNARRIMLFGCGPEGLQYQGFAMRLHHLGQSVSVQGDMAAPPAAAGYRFLTSAGLGSLATISALMRQARSGGAFVLFEALILTLIRKTDEIPQSICARHTNME